MVLPRWVRLCLLSSICQPGRRIRRAFPCRFTALRPSTRQVCGVFLSGRQSSGCSSRLPLSKIIQLQMARLAVLGSALFAEVHPPFLATPKRDGVDQILRYPGSAGCAHWPGAARWAFCSWGRQRPAGKYSSIKALSKHLGFHGVPHFLSFLMKLYRPQISVMLETHRLYDLPRYSVAQRPVPDQRAGVADVDIVHKR